MELLLIAVAAGLVWFLSKKGVTTPNANPPAAPPGSPALPGQIPAPDAPSAPNAPAHPDNVADAVKVALATETDPAKLAEFAASLLPDYPAESAQLAARAGILSLGPALPPAVVEPVAPPAPPPPGPADVPVIPPTPVAFPGVGSTAYVATAQNGAAGMLNVRAAPDSSDPTNIVSKVSRGGSLLVTGAPSNGFLRVLTPTGVDGWASLSYLAAVPPSDAAQPTTEMVT